MQSLIGISLAAINSATKGHNSVSDTQLDEAAMEAKARLQEDKEEWANADEEGGDGGPPVSVQQAEFNQAMSKGRRADEKQLQKLWNQSRAVKGGKKCGNASQPTAGSGRNYGYDRATQQKEFAAQPAGCLPPYLRGMAKPVESESKTQHRDGAENGVPKVALPPLSQQMQKRLVIIDDEEYGV